MLGKTNVSAIALFEDTPQGTVRTRASSTWQFIRFSAIMSYADTEIQRDE